MTTRPSSRTSRARRRRFATSAVWRVCREGRGREEREEETMLTEVWMVPLVVIALTETAVVATSVYLHRALAHRALAMHPVADVFFRTVLWLIAALAHATLYVAVLAPLINSLGHWRGAQNFTNTAYNSATLAWVTGGESLHNNHHAHPRAPKFSVRRVEFDPSWLVIRGLA